MKKKRILWIVLIVVVLGSAGAYFGLPLLNQSDSEMVEDTPMQTSTAYIGDITLLASGTGSIIASAEIEVAFEVSGTIEEIYVNVGDTVFEGDAMALLENDLTEAEINSGIATAQLAVIEAEQALEAITSDWQMEAAQALIAFEEAELAMEELEVTELELAEAKNAVISAQEAYDEALSETYNVNLTGSQANIDSAYADMLLAEETLKNTQKRFNRDFADLPETDITRAQAQSDLSAAQQAYDTAVANYNAMIATASDLEKEAANTAFDVAEAALAEAQAAYDELLAGPSAGEIALAEATLVEAQAEYERLKEGPDQTEITKAELTLVNAQSALELAEEQVAHVELIAPINGTVMQINGYEGENYGTSTFIILADLTQPLVDIYLDETDLDNVGVGYQVEVYFDALPDEVFTGTVIEVDPSMNSYGGFSALHATVQLDDFGKPQELPVGLTATVDVIGGQVLGAVLVPVEALQEIDDGVYGVFIIGDDGEPKLIPVEVGLMDYTAAEIISGLEAGDVITTGIVETD